MQGCVIKVRLLQSLHAQDQQKQALQSQFRKNCRWQLISSYTNWGLYDIIRPLPARAARTGFEPADAGSAGASLLDSLPVPPTVGGLSALTEEGIPVKRYSTALSGLLKLAVNAATT